MNLCPFLSISANTNPNQDKVDLTCIRDKCEVFDLEHDRCSLWVLAHMLTEKQVDKFTDNAEEIEKNVNKLLESQRSMKGAIEQIVSTLAPQSLKTLAIEVTKEIAKTKPTETSAAKDGTLKDPMLAAVEIIALKQDELKESLAKIGKEGLELKKPAWISDLSSIFESISKSVSEKATSSDEKADAVKFEANLKEIINQLSAISQFSQKNNHDKIVPILESIKSGQDGFIPLVDSISKSISSLGESLSTKSKKGKGENDLEPIIESLNNFEKQWTEFLTKQPFTPLPDISNKIQTLIEILSPHITEYVQEQNKIFITKLDSIISALENMKKLSAEGSQSGITLEPTNQAIDKVSKLLEANFAKPLDLSEIQQYLSQINDQILNLYKAVTNLDTNISKTNVGEIKTSINELSTQLSSINTEKLSNLAKVSADLLVIREKIEKQDLTSIQELPLLLIELTKTIDQIPKSIPPLDLTVVGSEKTLAEIKTLIETKLGENKLESLQEIPALLGEITTIIKMIPKSFETINLKDTNELLKEMIAIQKEVLLNQQSLSLTQSAIGENINKAIEAFSSSSKELFNLIVDQGKKYDLLIKETRANQASQHNDRGMYLYHQKAFIAAISEFEKALELDPEVVEVLNNIGLAYIEIGQMNKAEEAFKKLLEKRPNLAETYNNLGWLYYSLEDFDKAVDMYSKSLAINPSFVQAMLNLASVYETQKKLKEAINTWEKLMVIDPDNQIAKEKIGIYKGSV
ncbi:MAG: tetratricopeptide repeat protein [Candidatus Coatesbacteria bacterium]|nr:tetratricopeptide repeat protein [Candidatus Coatesbacteria bacterium]